MVSAKTRVVKIIKVLRKTYPNAKTALKHKNPLELLISTMLAAQCTDERVNKITPALFKKYKNAADFARARQSSLEKDIYSTGFYRNKAKNIIATSKKIVNEFKRNVPESMEELVTLPGVARKTANIVLSGSFGKAEGIAVDTHVRRLSQRMALTKENDPEKIEKNLMKVVPKKDWLEFNYIMVDHGRAVCKARRPRCADCVIGGLCPSKKL